MNPKYFTNPVPHERLDMVNPGAFHGVRLEFLRAQKGVYAAAVAGNFATDCIADIQRRYFKRFPVDLDHHSDPTPEHLAAVDDNAADPEVPSPDPELMPEEDYLRAAEAFDARRKAVEFRKDQIKRWMAYQYSKDRVLPAKDLENEPYTVLLAKLSGITTAKPRKANAFDLWAAENQEILHPALQTAITRDNPTRFQLAGLRTKVKKVEFDKLSPEVKQEWYQKVTEKNEKDMVDWKHRMESGPSTAPEDRQRCIEALPSFVQPILDGIAALTGFQVTMIAGGPEPADGGRLNVISVHSGLTQGEVKANFGRSERELYKKLVIPVFGSFLKKSYTVEECRARALPIEKPCLQSIFSDDNGKTDVHCVDWDRDVSQTPQPTTCPAEVTLQEKAQESAEDALSTPPPPAQVTLQEKAQESAEDAPSTPPPPAQVTLQQEAQDPVEDAPSTPVHSDRQIRPAQSPIQSPLPSPAGSSIPSPVGKPILSPVGRPVSSERSSPRDLPAGFPVYVPQDFPLWTAIIDSPSPVDEGRSSSPASSYAPSATNEETAPARKRVVSVVEGSGESGQGTAPKKRRRTSNEVGAVQEGAKSTKNGSPRRSRRSQGVPAAGQRKELQNTSPSSTVSARQGSASKKRTYDSAEDPPSKRSRVSMTRRSRSSVPTLVNSAATKKTLSASASADEIVMTSLPEDAPKWFVNAATMLRSAGWNGSWAVLLETWLKYELRSDLSDDGKLGTTNRPACIAAWIARARSPKWRPVIKDVTKFSEEFWAWWAGLQPEWRKDFGRDKDGIASGDWAILQKPGVNGIVSVLVALFYWGIALGDDREDASTWSRAVEEVEWVLGRL